MSAFWSAAHAAEVRRVRRLQNLFLGLHEVTLHAKDGGWKLPLYVTLNWLGDRLTKTYSALVWRRFPALTTGNKARQADLDTIIRDVLLETRVTPVQNCISYAGYAAWKLSWSARTGKPVLRRWGARPGEFSWWEEDGAEPYAVTFYRDEVLTEYANKKLVTARIGERFELIDGQVHVTNQAFEVSGDHVFTDKPVPLTAIYPEDTPKDEGTLDMSVLPGFLVHNTDESGDGRGDSDYTESLISLQASQAALATQRLLAIRINEMPALNVPVSFLNADGTLDLTKIMVTTREFGEDPKDTLPINLNNWTGNLENSSRQWELNNEEFYALTGLSPAIDGKAAGAGESGYARRLGLIKTEAAIESRRRQHSPFFPWLGIAVPELARTQGNTAYGEPIEDINETWPAAIPEDPNEVTDRTTTRFQAGGLSLEEYVRQNEPDMSPDEVAAEVARIQAAQQAKGQAALTSFANL